MGTDRTTIVAGEPFASALTRAGFRLQLTLAAELGLTLTSYLLTLSILYTDGYRDLFLWAPSIFIVSGLRVLGLYLFGPFRSSLRCASVPELLGIVKAIGFSSSLIYLFLNRLSNGSMRLSLGVIVLDWAICHILLGGLHFGARLYQTQALFWRRPKKRVAIIGAGDAGVRLVRELTASSKAPCRPVAIFDDNLATNGTTICGVPVVGPTQRLTQIARAWTVDEVLICIPSATRSEMSRILSICRRAKLPVRTLPTLAELIDGNVSQQDLRGPRIEDLLRREELVADPDEVATIVRGQVVLITGAGGSIGSELSRQIAAGHPQKLLLLDNTESNLFYIDREIRSQFPSLSITPLLIDVTQRPQLSEVFAAEKPSLVFHAAAYKHVGLLESNPTEAIRNNVLGTRNLAVAAALHETLRFVNISTDKAVNPQSYMGMSKRITELCIQNLSERSTTKYMNVRFGNVAGSSGSVLRLFWEQIQKGEPLCVTDPRATRFFMSIPEAVHLILRAASLGQGGETFVLEMGEPINIYELAQSMSILAGFAPGKEVPIHFVGLREGEKVNEELWSELETPAPTSCHGILMVARRDPLATDILRNIERLESMLRAGDRGGLDDLIAELFPAFKSKQRNRAPLKHAQKGNACQIPQEVS